ncbi:uncharacterized, partial [Tachysurus ichikawai]
MKTLIVPVFLSFLLS